MMNDLTISKFKRGAWRLGLALSRRGRAPLSYCCTFRPGSFLGKKVLPGSAWMGLCT